MIDDPQMAILQEMDDEERTRYENRKNARNFNELADDALLEQNEPTERMRRTR